MRRICCLGATVLIVTSCFDPSDPAESGTDTEAGTSSPTEATTPGTSSASTSTPPPGTGDGTSASSSGDSSDSSAGSGCADECPTPGTGCDGATLEVCTEGLDGCNDFEEVACDYGCMGGECLEAMADLGVSITGLNSLGTSRTVLFRVTNHGVADSGPFRADTWFARDFVAPPQLGDQGDQSQMNIPNLAPGESIDLQSTMLVPAGGLPVAVVIVDTLQAIAELDENNNASLGHAWVDAPNTVHASFTSDQAPVVIPTDGTTVTMSADVELPFASAPQVFFSVNVSHPRVEDLEISVAVAGGGPQRLLLTAANAGGNLQSTTFRNGGVDLGSGSPPYIGEFAPAGPWVGAGAPPWTGTYDLEIRDAGDGDIEGRLNAFTVHFYELDP